MKFVRVAIAIVLALLAQVLLPQYVWGFFRYFDFFLIVVIFNSINRPRISSTLVGTVSGLAEDTFLGTMFGFSGFTKTLIGYLASSFYQRFMVDNLLTQIAVLTVATWLREGIHLLLNGLLLGATRPGPTLTDILIMTGCNAIGGALIMRAVVLFAGRFSIGRIRSRGVSRLSR